MKRNQTKKRRIRTASVGKRPIDQAALNRDSDQNVPASVTTPHPLEIGSWLASIRGERHAARNLYVAILGIPLMVFCAWFFGSRDHDSIAVNPQNQHSTTGGQLEPTSQKIPSAPNAQASPSATISKNLDKSSSSAIQAGTPSSTSKSANDSLIAVHLARAKSLKGQKRYSEALAECERALQLDRGSKKARALKTEILTAQILEENDRPNN